MSGKRSAGLACLLGIGWLLDGCASLDAQAVAETHRLGSAPYYVEIAEPQPRPGSCAIVFPVTLDPELAQSFGYTDRASEFDPLLAALNARLADRQGCILAVPTAPAAPGPPRVYVGSAESEYAPQDVDQHRMPGDRFAPMVLHLDRPGVEWRSAAGALVAGSGVQ